jgi:L-alanine-DL-glutamate epimerase-like enolase superfamily enzyme
MRTTLGLRVSPLVKIETDAGITGYGECHHSELGYGEKDIVENVCRNILTGADPFDLEYLCFKMMTRTSYYGGNHGPAVHAVTGCEIALWDIIGQATGQPVRKILGGGTHTETVRAYATSGPRDTSPAGCREWAGRMKETGWTASKIDVRRDGQRWNSLDNRRLSNVELMNNVEAYENIRAAVGWDFDMICHCHWEFDFDSALRFCRGLEPVKLWWIEDPLPIGFNEQWVRLTEQSPVPVLCGENLYTRDDFQPFIVNQGVNMIEIDVSMAGGLLEAKKIADLAELYYMPVATHNVAGAIATVASANCAASIREFLGHELFENRGGNNGVNGDFGILGYDEPMFQQGYLHLSDKPGLGLDLDEDLLKSYVCEDETWWD